MPKAIYFISTVPDGNSPVSQLIKNVPGIEEINNLHGRYDTAIRITGQSYQGLKDTQQRIKNCISIREGNFQILLKNGSETNV